MSYKKAKELLIKYKDGTATDEEKAFVEKLLFGYNDDPLDVSEDRYDEIIDEIWENLPKSPKVTIRSMPVWARIAVAASILVCCSIGLYFYQHKTKPETTQIARNDIAPGSNGAILILANGTKIVLEQTKIGAITKQNGTNLRKAGDSLLIYQAGTPSVNEISYNTLETPKGKQYSVLLPDGSKVWLNAASSLKYPTTFSGSQRLVELTGEGYFEIIHNSRMPFRVKTGNQLVEDVGTHFNINAYSDEVNVKTTLLEGSVKISIKDNANNRFIKQGQQAVISNGVIAISEVDADEAIAWKEGYFQFDGENLEGAMRQIARWYDVDVEYKNNALRKVPLAGTISKYSKVSQVLKKMELTGKIHFSTSAHKITIE